MNPNFRINVAGVAEAVFDEALTQNPLEYAMWAKNGDPAADPSAYLETYAHPDGEWGEVHGFANGYADPEAVGALIDSHRAGTRPRHPRRASMPRRSASSTTIRCG
jgi:peptide/nickel transport system substrate-binding protein